MTDFPTRCRLAREKIARRLGPNAASDFTVLLDLIEELGRDKQDAPIGQRLVDCGCDGCKRYGAERIWQMDSPGPRR